MPGARELPRVDDHIVVPQTREEMVRGQRMLALPALPPHGDQHNTLDTVIGPHVVEGYVASTDLLTRFAEGSDFAADLCVRKAGVDAQGSRHLEELAFEVVSTQTRRSVTERAQDMTGRGVRRVIAVFVDAHTVEEWLASEQRWQVLDGDSSLSDPTLVRPLLVRALLDAGLALNEVVKAAELKGVPRTREIREEGELAGELAGKRALLESFCALRGIPVSPAQRSRLHQLDTAQLDGLFRRLVTDQRWPSGWG